MRASTFFVPWPRPPTNHIAAPNGTTSQTVGSPRPAPCTATAINTPTPIAVAGTRRATTKAPATIPIVQAVNTSP